MNQSINNQAAMLLAEVSTDGSGGLGVVKRQQGVRSSVGTSGWSFTTNGTDGSLTLAIEGAAADASGNENIIATVTAQGASAAYHATVTTGAANTLTVVVYDASDGTTAIDLSADAVTVSVVGGPA